MPGERGRKVNNYKATQSASVPSTSKKPAAVKSQSTPPRRIKSESKRQAPAVDSSPGDSPWMKLSNNGKLARSRVALFLKLNGSNKGNQLEEHTIRDILTKCGVSKRQMESMIGAFCGYFGSKARHISFSQFDTRLPPNANEKTIWEIVQELSTVE